MAGNKMAGILCSCFLLLQVVCVTAGASTTNSSEQQQNQQNHKKKKYVIEVQDHQQAMRYANPIIDLEDSVRRGINDPLADPRFIMNRIDGDYFGSPQPQNNRFRTNEFMSYHNAMHNGNIPSMNPSGSILGVGTDPSSRHYIKGLTPIPERSQSAIKEEIVSRHPPSIPMLSDMLPYPRQPFRSPTNILNNRKPPTFLPMSDVNSNPYLSANIGQNVADGLSQGLPGGTAAFGSAKINPLESRSSNNNNNNDAMLMRELLQKQLLQKQLLQRQLLQRQLFQKQLIQKDILEKELVQKQLQQKDILQKEFLQKQLFQKQLQQKEQFDKQLLLQKELIEKLNKEKLQQGQQLQQQRLKLNIQNNMAELAKQKILRQQLLSRRMHKISKSRESINELTGLPEDLEDRTYGSVSSVTSISDTPPAPIPTSVTVNVGTDDQRITSLHPQHGMETTGTKETSVSTPSQESSYPSSSSFSEAGAAALSSSSSASPSFSASPAESSSFSASSPSVTNTPNDASPHQEKTQLEENFPSIKSFLEADTILREKLNKQGDEPVDISAASEKTLGDINLGPDFDISVGDNKAENPSKRNILHGRYKKRKKKLH